MEQHRDSPQETTEIKIGNTVYTIAAHHPENGPTANDKITRLLDKEDQRNRA